MAKMKIFLFLFLIILSSCKQKNTVEGKIEGLGSDTLLVRRTTISRSFETGGRFSNSDPDTIYVKNDRFTYNNTSNNSEILELYPISGIKRLNGVTFSPASLEVFLQVLPNDKIKITGSVNQYHIDYKVTGSTISNDYNQLRKKKLKYMIAYVKNYLHRDTLRFNNGAKSEIDRLGLKNQEFMEISKKMDFEYIHKNWDKDLSAYLLWYHGELYGDHKKLKNNVRNGVYAPFIDNEIERFLEIEEINNRRRSGLIKEGNMAPDFTLETLNGSAYNLNSAFNSNTIQFIVLDFWGSWCGPCIKGFPKMKEYYMNYGHNIEFIGIACKDKKEDWKRSVKENDLKWPQLLNIQNKESDVSVKYAVKTYPTKIIIDKEKKIVGIFEGESNEFYKKLDELMLLQ